MIVTIFRSRLRAEHQEEYERMAARMHDLAQNMLGFVSIKTFTASDGERVSLVEFDSEAAHQAWRQHPEHREAQRLGREKFYSEYRIQVCRLERDYGKKAEAGEAEPGTQPQTH
jgi:heme-degrading monooxygenase HmoA